MFYEYKVLMKGVCYHYIHIGSQVTLNYVLYCLSIYIIYGSNKT